MMRIFHFAWSKTADESQIEYEFFWEKGWVHMSGQNKNCRAYPCAHQFIGQRELDHWLLGSDIVSRWRREKEREGEVSFVVVDSFSCPIQFGLENRPPWICCHLDAWPPSALSSWVLPDSSLSFHFCVYFLPTHWKLFFPGPIRNKNTHILDLLIPQDLPQQ
jgi:hypothetical protein